MKVPSYCRHSRPRTSDPSYALLCRPMVSVSQPGKTNPTNHSGTPGASSNRGCPRFKSLSQVRHGSALPDYRRPKIVLLTRDGLGSFAVYYGVPDGGHTFGVPTANRRRFRTGRRRLSAMAARRLTLALKRRRSRRLAGQFRLPRCPRARVQYSGTAFRMAGIGRDNSRLRLSTTADSAQPCPLAVVAVGFAT